MMTFILTLGSNLFQLIEKIISKGGTTQVALEVLNRNDNLDNLMIEAINSACNKSKILANKDKES